MPWKPVLVAMVLICLMTVLGIPFLDGLAMDMVPLPSPGTPRSPILIERNANFTEANGVTVGSGTEGDPYIIKDWKIEFDPEREGLVRGIHIKNTTAFFVIRNVETDLPITLDQVSNGRLENLNRNRINWGIWVTDSHNIAVAGSTFLENNVGLRIDVSTNVSVMGSEFRNNSIAIHVWRSENLTLADNEVSGSRRSGVYIGETNNGSIRGNTFSLTTDVYYPGGGAGLWLDDATMVKIHHNDFVKNAKQAHDDGGQENSWDDSYPTGGNYWSDASGVDECSGPDQMTCDGGDGILDAPYVVDSNTIDRYPLKNPINPQNIPLPTPLNLTVPIIVGAIVGAVGLTSFYILRKRRSSAEDD